MSKMRISMNQKMKLLLTPLFVGAFALTSSANVVGFFHVGANAGEVYTASGGDLQPTEVIVGIGPFTYGDLTISLDAQANQFKLTLDSDSYFETAPLITSIGSLSNDNMWDNGIQMDDDLPHGGLLTHTISGLTIGQEYRLQYTATMRGPNATQTARTEQIDLEGFEGLASVGTATLGTFMPPSGTRDWGFASSYLEWTATETSIDLAFDSTAGSTDGKIVNGIIVEAIPEPATTVLVGLGALGMLLTRRFRHHA